MKYKKYTESYIIHTHTYTCACLYVPLSLCLSFCLSQPSSARPCFCDFLSPRATLKIFHPPTTFQLPRYNNSNIDNNNDGSDDNNNEYVNYKNDYMNNSNNSSKNVNRSGAYNL